MDEDEEKPRATVGGLKEMKGREEGQKEGSSEIKRRWRTPGVEMGPTARFSAVLRLWRACRGKGCVRSSEIKFFSSLRIIGRAKRKRERDRGPNSNPSWFPGTRFILSFIPLLLFLTLSLFPLLSRYNRLLFLVSHRFLALQSQNVAGLEHRWDIDREGTNFEIPDFIGSPLCKKKKNRTWLSD